MIKLVAGKECLFSSCHNSLATHLPKYSIEYYANEIGGRPIIFICTALHQKAVKAVQEPRPERSNGSPSLSLSLCLSRSISKYVVNIIISRQQKHKYLNFGKERFKR